MKELPSPSPLPAIITTDPVGDAAAAAAAAAATDPAAQGEKSLPGCHSIALISDSWCTNNCLMGNCPKDMCSDECFAEPVVVEVRSNATPTDAAAVSPAPEEAKPVDPSECRSINDAIASDSWCMSSCSLGNCPATICSEGCKDQPQARGPQQQQQQQQEGAKKVSPSPSPAPKASKHSALWLAKHAAQQEGTPGKQQQQQQQQQQEEQEVVKPRTVGEQLRETVQLKANLTMA